MSCTKALVQNQDCTKATDLPYDDIDIEVRRLVWLMNQWPGIRTVGSCAGHTWPSPEAGISFVADTQDALASLIAALPPLGWRGGMIANLSQWEALTLTVQPDGDGIGYSLNIDGYPQHVQRALIGKIEKTLEKAIAIGR